LGVFQRAPKYAQREREKERNGRKKEKGDTKQN
jgi:hypothetical protein